MLKFKLEGNHIEVSNESKSYNIDVITEDIIHIFDNIGQYEFKKESTYKGKVEVDQKEDEIVIKLNKYIIIYICALIFMVILIVLIIHFIKNSSTDNLSIIFDEFERRF